MAVLTFDLIHGFKVGESVHMECGLRELDSADVIDAQIAAEKVIVQEGVATSYTSDVLLGLELLRRQIEYVGDVQGPFSIKNIRQFHPNDVTLIQKKAEQLDVLLAQELEQRGRPEGAS